MKDATLDETVIETLEAALASDDLPTPARDYARHLLRRLASPVRVSILGLPGSGKSQLINMLLGEVVLPDATRLPTTEIVYGDTARMMVTTANGKVHTENKLDLNNVPKNAAFLKVELPSPILQRVSILEVVTDGTAAELSSAIDWSVRRTDIALWCSQEFDEAEQIVWRRVPDSLKDHAFLVLTKADALSAENKLSKQVASLETVVAEEFHSLFAVATLQAIKAHRGDGAVDEAAYHASGGGALKSEILRHAERGRRADFDGAHLFLARYHIDPKAARPKSKSPTLVKVADAPQAAPEPVAETPQPKIVAAAPAPVQVENPALLTDAVRFLKRRGDTLAEAISDLEPGQGKQLMGQCVSAVEYLTDLFTEDDSGCPVVDAFIDEMGEATDMMVLMQVEEGDAAAADAATLLLQLRRDFEMKLAA